MKPEIVRVRTRGEKKKEMIEDCFRAAPSSLSWAESCVWGEKQSWAEGSALVWKSSGREGNRRRATVLGKLQPLCSTLCCTWTASDNHILNVSLLHPCGHLIYSSYWFLLTPSVLHTILYHSLCFERSVCVRKRRKIWPHTQTCGSIAISHKLAIMERRQ